MSTERLGCQLILTECLLRKFKLNASKTTIKIGARDKMGKKTHFYLLYYGNGFLKFLVKFSLDPSYLNKKIFPIVHFSKNQFK